MIKGIVAKFTVNGCASTSNGQDEQTEAKSLGLGFAQSPGVSIRVSEFFRTCDHRLFSPSAT
jgi:hypothetical protein